MLGAMCGMYGGKEVKGNVGLGGSAVSYTQFVLGSAKKFDFKTWKTLSPTHKKASYGPSPVLGAKSLTGMAWAPSVDQLLLHKAFIRVWSGGGRQKDRN